MNNTAHLIVREYFEWGTLGKGGKLEEHKKIVLCDMSNHHIGAILSDQFQISRETREIFETESRYRYKRLIMIKDA